MPEGSGLVSSSFAPSSSSRRPQPRHLTRPPPRRDPFAPDGLFLLQRTPAAITAASPRAANNTLSGGLGSDATTMAHAAYVRRLAALQSPQRRPQLATLVGSVREGRRAAAAAALEAAQAKERRRLQGQQEAEMAGIWDFFWELTLGLAPTSETYLARLAETRALAAGAERRFTLERRQLEREQAQALREAQGLPFNVVAGGEQQHIKKEVAKAEEEGDGKSAAAGSSSDDDDDEEKEEEQVSVNKRKVERQGGETPPPATPLKRRRRASLDSADSSTLPPPAATPAVVVKRPRGRPPKRLIGEKDE